MAASNTNTQSGVATDKNTSMGAVAELALDKNTPMGKFSANVSGIVSENIAESGEPIEIPTQDATARQS